MFPIPDDPHADVRQWLNNGVFCNEEGVAFKYLGLARATPTSSVLGTPLSRNPDVPLPDEVVVPRQSVRLHWPLGGAVNNESFRFAFIMQRLPRRQYARTFAHNQVECLVPRGFEVLPKANRRGVVRTTHDDVLRAIFYPMYPTDYEQVAEMLDAGWASVAMTRRIILVMSEGKELVYDGMTHVGHIYDRRFYPSCSEAHAMKVLKAFKGALQL